MLNIALPKGRLGEKVYDMFEKAGFPCPSIKENNRKLIFENEEAGVRYFWVKPSDVAIYVERGAADIGVATFQIAKNEGAYVILDEPLSQEQYAIGFLLGNTELRDTVNEQLLALAADGTMLEIAQNYVDAGLVLENLCLIEASETAEESPAA